MMPCKPNAPGAQPLTWADIDPDDILEPPVTMEDMLHSLATTKPSVNHDDLKQLDEWTKEFGSEGA